MWFLYALFSNLLMALVNYSDEYLTQSSSTKASSNIHKRIGGVLIASALLCFVSAFALFLFIDITAITAHGKIIALLTSVLMLLMWAGYFYMFQLYSAHQIVPLFGLTSMWLLLFELLSGATIGLLPLLGILILIGGAYFLDSGEFKWKIPSRLLKCMLPITFLWAAIVFLVRSISFDNDVFVIYFWQLSGICLLGLLLLLAVKPYRQGFLGRLKNDGAKFVLPSAFNETCSQIAFLLGFLSAAIAPLAVYVTAMGGVQSIFLLIIFYFFPLGERNTINRTQWFGVGCIALGIALLEAWK